MSKNNKKRTIVSISPYCKYLILQQELNKPYTNIKLLNMKKILITLFLFLNAMCYSQDLQPAKFSIAGFFPLASTGRQVYDFNNGWRFHLGDTPMGATKDLCDKDWEVISTPHSVSLIPSEGSGCRNYQGIAWYRKHFVVPSNTKGKNVTLHFEGIMGKQHFYINGKEVAYYEGGYLPINISLTENGVASGDSCIIAVKVDNSNDYSFPPGKPQYSLDFAYHGGIYRDVWLIAKAPISITDAVQANKVAGGGVFVHYANISEQYADVFVDTDVSNHSGKNESFIVESTLIAPNGKIVKKLTSKVKCTSSDTITTRQHFKVKNPFLWSPDEPSLYRLESRIKQANKTIDGGMTRIGIRECVFDGKKGFILNGKPFGQLVGANRHQDFAYVGNAVPNSQQWRDAKRLRDAGCRIIRAAHYPQDPAFMDACDELGMFVIVATPGWQYWNKNPHFEEKVQHNTRSMIRRDRNHPSVIMWEPILNETGFPKSFALNALNITKEEFPYPGRPLAAADMESKGIKDNYDIVYGRWRDDEKANAPKQCIFTREFGEYVDDWYAHNAKNRAARSWGENAMRIQALSLADTYSNLYKTTGKYIGGALWHPFDHQRGYHPDPYWGGIFDAFRQPKYAYYLFRSQTSKDLRHPMAESGPMVYIMHEMSPFSPSDVVVFSNCDSVRLSLYDKSKTWTLPVIHKKDGLPSSPVVFPGVWNFDEARKLSYSKKWQQVNMIAEGIVDGKVVAVENKMPSRRSTKIRLRADWNGHPLVANGSDFIVVIAEITDDNGNVRRLAKEEVVFEVEGEGEIIGDETIGANPRLVEWGSAPVLIRSTLHPGKIHIRAHVKYEGTHAPKATELTIESVPSTIVPLYSEEKSAAQKNITRYNSSHTRMSDKELNKVLDEVSKQQTEFGIQ